MRYGVGGFCHWRHSGVCRVQDSVALEHVVVHTLARTGGPGGRGEREGYGEPRDVISLSLN